MGRTFETFRPPWEDKSYRLRLKDGFSAKALVMFYERLQREAYLCLDSATADPSNHAWWHGRATGMLDAMMLLDGSWPGLDTAMERYGKWRYEQQQSDREPRPGLDVVRGVRDPGAPGGGEVPPLRHSPKAK